MLMGAAFRFGFKLKSPSQYNRQAPRLPRAKTRHAVVNFKRLRDDPIVARFVPDISELKIPIEQRKTFMELGANHCRYGNGEVGSPDFYFCGGETIKDSSYCEAHHRHCHTVWRPSVKACFVL